MASFKLTELNSTSSTAVDSLIYVADKSGDDYNSKQITVANLLQDYNTSAQVDAKIADLIGGAPAALDPLKEIADLMSGADGSDIVGNLVSMIDANETHMDNMATLTGVAKDSTDLGSFTGSTIGSGLSVKSALQAVETALEAAGVSAAGDTAAVGSRLANLISLSGQIADTDDFGTVFTGSTIADDATITTALQDLETAHETEVADRISAVSAEATARTNADDALQANIDAEEAARIAADRPLTTNLAQEVTDRTAAVSTEASARAAADTTLQSNIDAEESARISADSTLTTNLATEVTDRQNAVSALDTAYKAADSTLTANLAQEVTDRTTAVSNEASARSAADTTLQSNIDAEESARIAADTTLTNNLATEVSDRQSAVTAEATARAAADTTLTNNLATEVSDRAAAVTAEANARIAADNTKVTLQTKVNEVLVGETLPQSEPASYLFLVVDSATGQLKSIDKTFLETEASA